MKEKIIGSLQIKKRNKSYCIRCNKYSKLKNPKLSDISNERLVPSINCSKRGNDNRIFQEDSIEILKMLE